MTFPWALAYIHTAYHAVWHKNRTTTAFVKDHKSNKKKLPYLSGGRIQGIKCDTRTTLLHKLMGRREINRDYPTYYTRNDWWRERVRFAGATGIVSQRRILGWRWRWGDEEGSVEYYCVERINSGFDFLWTGTRQSWLRCFSYIPHHLAGQRASQVLLLLLVYFSCWTEDQFWSFLHHQFWYANSTGDFDWSEFYWESDRGEKLIIERMR